MLSQFILKLAILLFFYKPAKLDINQILPKVTQFDVTHGGKDYLAPPPINFEREKVKVNGKDYEVTFDGEKLNIRDDREPDFPFIIEAPNKRYWIKVRKDRPWISLEGLAGDHDVLAELVKKASGFPPPPPDKPMDKNGGNHEWFDPPFKIGDFVSYLPNESLGRMIVSDIWLRILPESKKLVWFVIAVYRIGSGTTFEEVRDFAANFKKIGL